MAGHSQMGVELLGQAYDVRTSCCSPPPCTHENSVSPSVLPPELEPRRASRRQSRRYYSRPLLLLTRTVQFHKARAHAHC